MARVICICGKICSGKTTYCKGLMEQEQRVVLSCDELESALFPRFLGEEHERVLARIQEYLHKKAAEIVAAGSTVILDWGFWGKEERQEVSARYQALGLPVEWHYIDISEKDWQRNIAARNKGVVTGETRDYGVDDGLLQKLATQFQAPAREEMQVWYGSGEDQ